MKKKLTFCTFLATAMTSLAAVRNNYNMPELDVKGQKTQLAPVTPDLSAANIVDAINAGGATYNGRPVLAFQYDAGRVGLFLLVDEDVAAGDIRIMGDGGHWNTNVAVTMAILDPDWRIAPPGYISMEKALLLATATAIAVK